MELAKENKHSTRYEERDFRNAMRDLIHAQDTLQMAQGKENGETIVWNPSYADKMSKRDGITHVFGDIYGDFMEEPGVKYKFHGEKVRGYRKTGDKADTTTNSSRAFFSDGDMIMGDKIEKDTKAIIVGKVYWI